MKITPTITKALSIKQPWVWAILHAGKDIENRSWQTKYRGWIALHASARPIPANQDPFPGRDGSPDLKSLDYSVICGVAELVDIVTSSDSKWFYHAQDGSKNYGWVLRNATPLAEPISCKGALGLWEIPDEIQSAIRNQFIVSGNLIDSKRPAFITLLEHFLEIAIPTSEGFDIGTEEGSEQYYKSWRICEQNSESLLVALIKAKAAGQFRGRAAIASKMIRHLENVRTLAQSTLELHAQAQKWHKRREKHWVENVVDLFRNKPSSKDKRVTKEYKQITAQTVKTENKFHKLWRERQLLSVEISEILKLGTDQVEPNKFS